MACAALAAPHEVVPLGDQVAERAALVAERDAAVHAATGLAAQLGGVALLVDLFPVHDAHRTRGAASGSSRSVRLQEALRGQPPVTSRIRAQTTSPSGSSPSSTALWRVREHRGVVARQHLGESVERGVARRRAAAPRPAESVSSRCCSSRSRTISRSALPSGCSSSSPRAQRLAVHPLLAEVEHVGGAARHAGTEVAPGLAEDEREAAGHVLERVVAHALDDRGRTRVAHEEALAHDAADEHAAAGRAVADDVAGDDVALGGEAAVARRAHARSGRPRGPCRRSRSSRPRGAA